MGLECCLSVVSVTRITSLSRQHELPTNALYATAVDTITVAGAALPVSDEIRSLGVIIDRRLTFEIHTAAVVKSCKCHIYGRCSAYSSSAAFFYSSNFGLQSDALAIELLQCRAVRLSSCHSSTAAHTELPCCRSVRPPQAVTVITLVAGTATTGLQDSTHRVEIRDHVDSSITE